LDKTLKSCKGIQKNSVTPSKDQTCESRTLKNKRFNPIVYIIYPKNNSRKVFKSQERNVHSGTRTLQDIKQITKIETLPGKLLLKQTNKKKNRE
jgi:hypothetical protein